jgi:hypothetical protein
MSSPDEKGTPPSSDHKVLHRVGTDSSLTMKRAATNATAVGQGLPFPPHTASATKVLEALSVADSRRGLSETEAARRLEQYGLNRIKPPAKPSLFKICMRQVANAMTLVLSEYKKRIDRCRLGGANACHHRLRIRLSATPDAS